MRIHEYLEIVEEAAGESMGVCRKCGSEFCEARDYYKKYALLREKDWSELPRRRTLSGEPPFIVYQEFICPGCATLLNVDTLCKALDADDLLVWDIQVEMQ